MDRRSSIRNAVLFGGAALAFSWLVCIASIPVANAQVVVAPSSVSFPETVVGVYAPPATVSVENRSPVAATVAFRVFGTSCPAVIGPLPEFCSKAVEQEYSSYLVVAACANVAPGASCDVTIRFAPKSSRMLVAKVAVLVDQQEVTAFKVTGAGVPVSHAVGAIRAIEFVDVARLHYFITPSEDEIRKLDEGYFPGWSRSGYSFWVWPTSDATSGVNPVCRFYGRPEAGLDSHFYSAAPAECQAVIDRFSSAWVYETPELFGAKLPSQVDGACPANSVPLYRLYNNKPDVNHRYMVLRDAQWETLRALYGWIPEGYGTNATIMCLPSAVYEVP